MGKKSLIFTSLLSLLLNACDSKNDAAHGESPAVPVIASVPSIKDITVYVEEIGTLQPVVSMEIRPQVSGTLSEVHVMEGQWVEKGDSLFAIDPMPYKIKVTEAEALLSMDLANLQAVAKKLERYRDLAEKDFMAQTEWDDLEAQVDKAQASVDLDEARLAAAKLELDHCTLFSPVAGSVGKIDVHPGYLVAANQTTPLVTISKIDPLLIEFNVTEGEFPKISKGELQVEVKALCAPCVSKTGLITFIDDHFDSKTGQLLVRGKIPNADFGMRPGQTVRVRIPVATTSNMKLIPQKAVRYNQQGPYVYVVQPDMTVTMRQVILGDEEGDSLVVLEGLDAAEPVVSDGHLRIFPGIKVTTSEIKS